MRDYLNNKKPQKILLPLIRTLEGHSSWATAVSVTPDGNCAVSASDDRTLKGGILEQEKKYQPLVEKVL